MVLDLFQDLLQLLHPVAVRAFGWRTCVGSCVGIGQVVHGVKAVTPPIEAHFGKGNSVFILKDCLLGAFHGGACGTTHSPQPIRGRNQIEF